MSGWVALRFRFSLSRLPSSVVARNAASSFFALGWLSLLSMLAIPVYIKLLGVSEWGLVAACASLQLVSNFVDVGFSQIVPRWVAREAHDPTALRSYVALFRKMYLGLGLLVFVLLQVGAGYLAQSWFQVLPNRSGALELAIRIISFQMMFQFVNNLHVGLWHGMQKQVLANLSVAGFGTLKHVATMAVLIVGPAQAWLYAITFATVAMLEVLTNAWLVRRTLGVLSLSDEAVHVPVKPFLREVTVLSGGILVGLTVSQMDRFILSRSVSLEEFGVYTVIATLSLAFLQLQAPMTRAYFPLLVHDIQALGRVSVVHMKRLIAGTLVFSTLPALLACVFAGPLLSVWLHNPKFVELGERPMQLLLLAVAANTLYGCIYQVIVAAGRSQLVLAFNLVALAVAVLVVAAAATTGQEFGLLLGGLIWLATTLTQLLLGLVWFTLHGSPSLSPSEKPESHE